MVEHHELVGRGYVVDALQGAVHDGDLGLDLVPGLLKRVCNESAWRRRFVECSKEIVEFTSFTAFVEATKPDGLGVKIETLRKLCRDDPEARDIIDRETQRPPFIHASDLYNIQVIQAPTGTSADRALRKLRADAPSLHRRVIAGELSAHAAMIEAGFRRKTLTVPADPERAAKTLARHFDPDELKDLIAELQSLLTDVAQNRAGDDD